MLFKKILSKGEDDKNELILEKKLEKSIETNKANVLTLEDFEIFSVSGAFLINLTLSLNHCTPAPAIKIEPSKA